MSERLSQEVGRLSWRLAEFLETAFPRAEGALAQNLAFLRSSAATAAGTPAEDVASRTPGMGVEAEQVEPLDRLMNRLGCSRGEMDFLVFAGMPDEHEGYAAVLRTLHPRGEPRPSLGLAAQLLSNSKRGDFLAWVYEASIFRHGAVRLSGETPLFERSLELADALWPALHGCQAWPGAVGVPETRGSGHGLEEWMSTDVVRRARRALETSRPCTLLITADTEDVAFQRAMALVVASGRNPVGFGLPGAHGGLDGDRWRSLRLHALLRGAVLVLRLPVTDGPGSPEPPSLEGYPDAAIVAGRTGAAAVRGNRPLIALTAERLTAPARKAMWVHALGSLAEAAPRLAARYSIEPSSATEVAADLECLETLENRAPRLEDVGEAVRARAAVLLSGGVKLIRPKATWDHLVLSPEREAQLRAAIDRLELQARVLDDWGFLRGRAGARGVRMLFSGPPGTGKTLSAEVMASALQVDLLFVDISRVVSKWIGETEKNLSAVFDTAERAQAVLFFDEADALFGRRTEVSDAHDRYANLETAYLLARLERFEGLAVLSTNLRQNIDPAFLRRLEFVVDFDEPDREERHRLWRCHVPSEDLLEGDVNLVEFASLYAVVGGFIRNAAVAAAFLAAADGGKIGRGHLLKAIRREYEKSGKAFPGMPAGTRHS